MDKGRNQETTYKLISVIQARYYDDVGGWASLRPRPRPKPRVGVGLPGQRCRRQGHPEEPGVLGWELPADQGRLSGKGPSWTSEDAGEGWAEPFQTRTGWCALSQRAGPVV